MIGKAFLGEKPKSPSGVAGLQEFWSSIRDGLIFAASFGFIAFLEQVDAIDFGPIWDGVVAAGITAGIQFIRRWMKDYSPDPVLPPRD